MFWSRSSLWVRGKKEEEQMSKQVCPVCHAPLVVSERPDATQYKCTKCSYQRTEKHKTVSEGSDKAPLTLLHD